MYVLSIISTLPDIYNDCLILGIQYELLPNTEKMRTPLPVLLYRM